MSIPIIEEFREITENISVARSKLTTINREIDKLIYADKPGELKSIDYSKDKIQGNSIQSDIFTNYAKMQELFLKRDLLEREKESLYKQRDELEKTINNLGDNNRKVLMLKIKGCKNWQIAKTLNYSERQIERIVADSKKKLN